MKIFLIVGVCYCNSAKFLVFSINQNYFSTSDTPMAMQRKEKHTKLSSEKESPIIPVRYQHLASLLVIVVSLVIFFHEAVFDGKVFSSGDSISGQSFKTLV